MGKWTRRAFIGTGALVGGGFVLGLAGAALAPVRHGIRSDDPEATGELNTWILITPDNIVTVLVPHCEMGQGAQTALAMMAAEEMDADWNLVRVKEAPALKAYANEYVIRAFLNNVPRPFERGFDYGTYRLMRFVGIQVTGGSMSVRGTGHYGMRLAGASARQMLLDAAAEQFGVRASDCTIASSRVTAGARAATFGELAKLAAAQPVPMHPRMKDPKSYTLRRQPQQRFDLRSKVDGSAIYGIDFTMPGLLHAAVEIAPVNGGKLVSVDSAAAAQVAHVAVSPEGVLKVKHVCAAVDCGDVVNLDTATAQVEGGTIFGLSAALMGAITIDKGAVIESNFHDYLTMHMADAPTVAVDFVISGAHPGGLGEPAVPPIAAAVANAIFAATGVRVRELPFKDARLAVSS